MTRRRWVLVAPLILTATLVATLASLITARPARADSGTAASFWLAGSDGNVWAFGRAGSYGSAGSVPLASPIVDIAATPDDKGYWLVGADGGVMTYGDARFFGSTGALRLTRPIVGLTPTPDGAGYWLVASDGGVFSFGDAAFHGSTGALRLAQPIVGLTPSADGAGYWLVARDGGIFSFGDATFHGSAGALRLARPIMSMAATPDGAGYWLMASDGGVFAFGTATYAGSLGGSPSPEPAERIVASHDGGGYWLVLQNGTSFGYGDASGAAPAQALMFNGATPGDRAVLFAFHQLGKPYIWGGNGPVGYDCSGLALASWTVGAGIRFARVANDQYHTAGGAIAYSSLVAGDLVFWGSSQTDWTSVYHTAMYVGGGRIVEATGDHVQLNSLGQWGQSDLMPHGDRP
jgi:cell wall-associated NlpC family hydrolase